MIRSGVRMLRQFPITTITREDPYQVVAYGRGVPVFARTFGEMNTVLQHLARDVPTDKPEHWRIEAFFPKGGALVWGFPLSRAHQVSGVEVSAIPWELGMTSGGMAWE